MPLHSGSVPHQESKKVYKNKFKLVAAGGRGFACGITLDDDLRCFGALINPHFPMYSIPEIPEVGKVKKVIANDDSICALDMKNETKCWGMRVSRAVAPQKEVKDIFVGDANNICVANFNNEVTCVSTTNREKINKFGNVKAIAYTYHTYCLIDLDDKLTCVGAATPQKLPEGLEKVKSIQAHADTFCAINFANQATCWFTNPVYPYRIYHEQRYDDVIGLNINFYDNSSHGAFGNQYCILKKDGTLHCAYSYLNEVMNPDIEVVKTPLNLPRLKGISGFRSHSCGIDLNDNVVCWARKSL